MSWRFIPLAILWLVGCGQVYPLPVTAQTTSATIANTSMQLPVPGATAPLNKPLHGFNLTVTSGWNEGAGYIPVRFELQRTTASAIDTTVTLHLKLNSGYGYYGPFGADEQTGCHVWQDVEIPAGAMRAEATLAILQFEAREGIGWEVLVDGSLAAELNGELPYYYNYRNYGNYSTHARFLIVESAASPQTVADLTLSMNPGISADEMKEVLDRQNSNIWKGSVAAESGILQLELPKFPTRPIDYNSLDIIYLSVDELLQLTQQKEAWRAVRSWVCSGGNLWIVGVKDNWQRLGEVETVLGLPTQPDKPEDRGWFTFDKTRGQAVGEDAFSVLEVDVDVRQQMLLQAQAGNANPATVVQTPTSVTTHIAPPSTLWHGLMLGQICVFSDDAPFAENPALAGTGMSPTNRFPVGSLFSWRESWTERNGVTLGSPNAGFWYWLVPGVGLAPVTMFQLLITLFVLIIGPVNFLLLKRLRRLYFLLITVPLAAGLITASLFAYAFISDGLSTRVRGRSFTEIDPATGQAATWARLSYYSGVAPADGLKFPGDTIVLPIESEPRYSYYASRRNALLETQWGREWQYLKGEWLPSRAPTQFMTIRTRQSPLRLEVVATPGAVQVKNELQTRVAQLLVCGDDGKFYWGEGIAAGQDAGLREIGFTAAKKQLMGALQINAPAYPPGWAGSYSTYNTNIGPWRNDVEQANLSTIALNSVLEVALERISRADPKDADSLYAPGRFVAMVEQSPEVAIGVPAEEQASVHVITGRWK